jgi:hypothetical protein
MTARLIKFMGSHPDLVTGHMYSARHFAGVAGISPNSMATRLRRVLEVHDSHLRPTEKETKFGSKIDTSWSKQKQIVSVYTTPTEKLSGAWLKRKLL